MSKLLERLYWFIKWAFNGKVHPILETPKPMPSEDHIIETISNRERLYNRAKSFIGRDASPKDTVSDDVACVESLQCVYRDEFGEFIATGAAFTSTWSLLITLKDHVDFYEVTEPLPGDIILSATGTGNGSIDYGHVGVCGKTHIMSNTSDTGIWEPNYTYKEWDDYFFKRGGFPTSYFRRK